MTEAQTRDLVRIWQIRLGLESWTLVVRFDDEPNEEEDCYAFCRPSKHFDDATLIFYRMRMQTLSKRKTEETVVHELLHCVHRDVESIVDLLEDVAHRDAVSVLTEAYEHSVEQFIDRQARVLVGLAPVTKPE